MLIAEQEKPVRKQHLLGITSMQIIKVTYLQENTDGNSKNYKYTLIYSKQNHNENLGIDHVSAEVAQRQQRPEKKYSVLIKEKHYYSGSKSTNVFKAFYQINPARQVKLSY